MFPCDYEPMTPGDRITVRDRLHDTQSFVPFYAVVYLLLPMEGYLCWGVTHSWFRIIGYMHLKRRALHLLERSVGAGVEGRASKVLEQPLLHGVIVFGYWFKWQCLRT